VTKLKLSTIPDDKPVKVTVELPAAVLRDLQAYAAILARAKPEATPLEPSKLIVPMLERFMATDRAFSKSKREQKAPVQR